MKRDLSWPSVFLFFWVLLFSQISFAQDLPGQSIQIQTFLRAFEGKPSWLIKVRDVDTGAIYPYLFDVSNEENTWVEIIFARHYRIIESTMNFGPPPCAQIRNYCHLEDGILKNKSFAITLTGKLTPNRFTSSCHILKYKNYQFPIVETETTTETTTTTTNEEADLEAPTLPVEGLPETAANVTQTVTNIIQRK